jgi:membrane associated rhomboid family serine protease
MISFMPDPDYFIVRVTSAKEFKEIELLLLSRSVPFSVRNDYWQKLFYIPKQSEEKARSELQSFLEENKNWPPPALHYKLKGFRFSFLHVCIVLCLAFFHWHVTQFDFSPQWLELGKFSATQVMAGDWWRLCTALTLHVDDAHLLSNMAGLLVFVGGVAYFTGPGLSWLLVVLSACLGNYFNALFTQTSQSGIGASTAVFAAVGLIGVFGIRSYYYRREMRTRLLVPFMAGFGIFAMMGTNPQTDVSAHLFGFICGAAIGLVFLPLADPQHLDSRMLQLVGFALFCLSVYGSWIYALQVSM